MEGYKETSWQDTFLFLEILSKNCWPDHRPPARKCRNVQTRLICRLWLLMMKTTAGFRHTPSTRPWIRCGRGWDWSLVKYFQFLWLTVQVFGLPVPDVNSCLYVSVYDEDKNHKTEFLGELSVFKVPTERYFFCLRQIEYSSPQHEE